MVAMKPVIVATALFVSCVVAFPAVQAASAEHAGQWETAMSATSYQGLSAGLAGVDSHKHKGVPFTLLTKYIVRPSLAKEFVGGWLNFRDVVKEAKGSRTINLSKPLTNNLVFYSYEEWECMGSFVRFVKENYAAKELIQYIEKHDIPLELTQLVPAVPYNKPSQPSMVNAASQVAGLSMRALHDLIGEDQETMLSKEDAVRSSPLETNTRNNTVIVLTKFLVKPSRIVEFVKAADLVTKAVAANEKGNLVYGLSKPLDDDVTFWSYAIWEDAAALKTHMESAYVRVFLKYILEQDIYTKTTPLIPIEQRQ